MPNLKSRIELKGVPSKPEERAHRVIAEAAPEVVFSTLEGKQLKLSDLRGQVVVLNFWATWCGPCRNEVPELNELQKRLKTRGVTVVGVSWDDTVDAIKDFQQEIPQEYTVSNGGEDTQRDFPATRSLPTTFIIDREGRIRERILGARDRAGFEMAGKFCLMS